MIKYLRPSWLIATIFLCTGCVARAAEEFPQIASYRISQTEKTSLGDALRPETRAHKNMSGFRVLSTGSESFAARLALIRAAEKTLDLQYYIIHDDTTANLLIEAMIRAAARGVRVRFLIDAISVGEVGNALSLLDGLKNIEIRVFNPVVTREHGIVGPLLKYTVDLDEYNRRMHNKTLIVDNQMAILGGRNLGDEYFEENTDMTFKDMDILTAGPITDAVSQSFDDYWNSKDSLPIGQIKTPARNPDEIAQIRQDISAHWDEVAATDKGKKLLTSKLHERLKDADVRLIWARAELAVDEPEKIDKDSDVASSKPINRLDRLLSHANREFVAVSPYFVPREEGVAWLKSLTGRGLKVKVLTNSLASTDVVAVHTGYRPYRKDLLEAGVELYEMKPLGGERPKQRLLGSSAPAQASLHSKVYVVDGKDVMIGSFNLDPRSVELNTEIALLIHSPEISAQMLSMFDEVTAPENSYHVMLDADGDLVWETEEKDMEKTYHRDPQAGLWRPIQSRLIGLLPIEEHL